MRLPEYVDNGIQACVFTDRLNSLYGYLCKFCFQRFNRDNKWVIFDFECK
jgi:hypothetical protein